MLKAMISGEFKEARAEKPIAFYTRELASGQSREVVWRRKSLCFSGRFATGHGNGRNPFDKEGIHSTPFQTEDAHIAHMALQRLSILQEL